MSLSFQPQATVVKAKTRTNPCICNCEKQGFNCESHNVSCLLAHSSSCNCTCCSSDCNSIHNLNEHIHRCICCKAAVVHELDRTSSCCSSTLELTDDSVSCCVNATSTVPVSSGRRFLSLSSSYFDSSVCNTGFTFPKSILSKRFFLLSFLLMILCSCASATFSYNGLKMLVIADPSEIKDENLKNLWMENFKNCIDAANISAPDYYQLKDDASIEKIDNLVHDLILIKEFDETVYSDFNGLLKTAGPPQQTFHFYTDKTAYYPRTIDDVLSQDTYKEICTSVKFINEISSKGNVSLNIITGAQFTVKQDGTSFKYDLVYNPFPMAGSLTALMLPSNAPIDPYNNKTKQLKMKYTIEGTFDNVQHLYDVLICLQLNKGEAPEKIAFIHNSTKDTKYKVEDEFHIGNYFESLTDCKSGAYNFENMLIKNMTDAKNSNDFVKWMKISNQSYSYKTISKKNPGFSVDKVSELKYVSTKPLKGVSLDYIDYKNYSVAFPGSMKIQKVSYFFSTTEFTFPCEDQLILYFKKQLYEIKSISPTNPFPEISLPNISEFERLPLPLYSKSFGLDRFKDEVNKFIKLFKLKMGFISSGLSDFCVIPNISNITSPVNYEFGEDIILPLVTQFPKDIFDKLKEDLKNEEYFEYLDDAAEYYKTYFDEFQKVLDASGFDGALPEKYQENYKEFLEKYKSYYDTMKKGYKDAVDEYLTKSKSHTPPTPTEIADKFEKFIDINDDKYKDAFKLSTSFETFLSSKNEFVYRDFKTHIVYYSEKSIRIAKPAGKSYDTLLSIEFSDDKITKLYSTGDLLYSPPGSPLTFKDLQIAPSSPNEYIAKQVNASLKSELKFLQVFLPLSYKNKSNNNLSLPATFASILSSQLNNLIATLVSRPIEKLTTPPELDFTPCHEVFKNIDRNLYSKYLINARVANDESALFTLHHFFKTFTSYFVDIIVSKIESFNRTKLKSNSIDVSKLPTFHDYLFLDEAFCRYTTVLQLLLKKCTKKELIYDPPLSYIDKILARLKDLKIHHFKYPSLLSVLYAHQFIWLGISNVSDPKNPTAKMNDAQKYFIDSYLDNSKGNTMELGQKSIMLYVTYVYEKFTITTDPFDKNSLKDSDKSIPPGVVRNVQTKFEYMSSGLVPNSSAFYGQLSQKVGLLISSDTSAGNIKSSESLYTAALNAFDRWISSTSGDPFSNITKQKVYIGDSYKEAYQWSGSLEYNVGGGTSLSLALIATNDDIFVAAKTQASNLDYIKNDFTVYVPDVHSDFPVSSPIEHYCFSNGDSFWCFNKKTEQIDVAATKDTTVPIRASFSDDFLKKLGIPNGPATGQLFIESVAFSFVMKITTNTFKYIVFPGFKYEGNKILLFEEESTIKKFQCKSSLGFSSIKIDLLGDSAETNFYYITVRSSTSTMAFFSYKDTKNNVHSMFCNVQEYDATSGLYYLCPDDRIHKLLAIKFLLPGYPLLAFEVFKKGFSVTTQPNAKELAVFKSEILVKFTESTPVDQLFVLFLISQPFLYEITEDEFNDNITKHSQRFLEERHFLPVVALNGLVDRPLAGYGHPLYEEKLFSKIIATAPSVKPVELKSMTFSYKSSNTSPFYGVQNSYEVAESKTENIIVSTLSRKYVLSEFAENDNVVSTPTDEFDMGSLDNSINSNRILATCEGLFRGSINCISSRNRSDIDKNLLKKIEGIKNLTLKNELIRGLYLRREFQLGSLPTDFNDLKTNIGTLEKDIGTLKQQIVDIISQNLHLPDDKKAYFEFIGTSHSDVNDLTAGLGECFLKNSKKCYSSFISSCPIFPGSSPSPTVTTTDAEIESIHRHLAFLYDIQARHQLLNKFIQGREKFQTTSANISPTDFLPLESILRKDIFKKFFYVNGKETFCYYALSAFEVFKKIVIRNDQLHSVIYLIHNNDATLKATTTPEMPPNKILKLLMGAGKTAVIGPLLSVLEPLCTKSVIVGFVSPTFAYEDNVSTYTLELKKLGLYVASFKYTRQIPIPQGVTFASVEKADEYFRNFENARLDRIYNFLEFCHRAKNVFMTTSESLLCFMNRRIELTHNYDVYKTSIECLDKILNLLKNHSHVAFDESHITFNPFQMLIFPVTDSKESLSSDVVEIMSSFLTAQLYPENTFRKPSIFSMDILNYRKQNTGPKIAVDRFFRYLKEQRTTFYLNYSQNIASFFDGKASLKDFLLDSDCYSKASKFYKATSFRNVKTNDSTIRKFIDEVVCTCNDLRYQQLCFQFSMMVHKLIHMLVPSVLEKSFNRDYGFHSNMFYSLDRIQVTPDFVYSIPYVAANSPSDNSLFANPYDVIVKTFLQYTVFGQLKIQNMQHFISFIYSDESWEDKYDVCFGNELSLSKLNADDMNSKESLLKILNKVLDTKQQISDVDMFKRKFSLITDFLCEWYFKKLRYDKYQIEASGSNIPFLVRKLYGYSGTPGPLLLYSKCFQNPGNGPLGTAASNLFSNDPNVEHTKIIVFKDDPSFTEQGPDSVAFLNSLFDPLFSKLDEMSYGTGTFRRLPSAVIDIAAVFKNFSNKEMAKILVHYLSGRCQSSGGAINYKGVVYYDDQLNVPYYLSLDGNTYSLVGLKAGEIRKFILELGNTIGADDNICENVHYLTYYDQQHSTGADFKFLLNNDALVLIDNRVQLDYFLQGIMRMRQFLLGQRAHICLSANMQQCIIDYLVHESPYDSSSKPADTLSIQDILTFTQLFQQKHSQTAIFQSFTQQLSAVCRDEAMKSNLKGAEILENSSLVTTYDFSDPIQDCVTIRVNFNEFIDSHTARSPNANIKKVAERFKQSSIKDNELRIAFSEFLDDNELKGDLDEMLKSLDKHQSEVEKEFGTVAAAKDWFRGYNEELQNMTNHLFNSTVSLSDSNKSTEKQNENKAQIESQQQKINVVKMQSISINKNALPISPLENVDLLDNSMYYSELKLGKAGFFSMRALKQTDSSKAKLKFLDSIREFYFSANIVCSYQYQNTKPTSGAPVPEVDFLSPFQKNIDNFAIVKDANVKDATRWSFVFITPQEADYYLSQPAPTGNRSYEIYNVRQLFFNDLTDPEMNAHDDAPMFDEWQSAEHKDLLEALRQANYDVIIPMLTGSVIHLNEMYVRAVNYNQSLLSASSSNDECLAAVDKDKIESDRLLKLFHGPSNFRIYFNCLLNFYHTDHTLLTEVNRLCRQLPVKVLLESKINYLKKLANELEAIAGWSPETILKRSILFLKYDPAFFDNISKNYVSIVHIAINGFIRELNNFAGHPVLHLVYAAMNQFIPKFLQQIKIIDDSLIEEASGCSNSYDPSTFFIPKNIQSFDYPKTINSLSLYWSIISSYSDKSLRNHFSTANFLLNPMLHSVYVASMLPNYVEMTSVFADYINSSLGISGIGSLDSLSLESFCVLMRNAPIKQDVRNNLFTSKKAADFFKKPKDITAESLFFLLQVNPNLTDNFVKVKSAPTQSHLTIISTVTVHPADNRKISSAVLKKNGKFLMVNLNTVFDSHKFEGFKFYVKNLVALGYRDFFNYHILEKFLNSSYIEWGNGTDDKVSENLQSTVSFYSNVLAHCITWRTFTKSFDESQRTKGEIESVHFIALGYAMFLQRKVSLPKLCKFIFTEKLPISALHVFAAFRHATDPTSVSQSSASVPIYFQHDSLRYVGCLITIQLLQESSLDNDSVKQLVDYLCQTPSITSEILQALLSVSMKIVSEVFSHAQPVSHTQLLSSFSGVSSLKKFVTKSTLKSPEFMHSLALKLINETNLVNNQKFSRKSPHSKPYIPYNYCVYIIAREIFKVLDEDDVLKQPIYELYKAKRTNFVLAISALVCLSLLVFAVIALLSYLYLQRRKLSSATIIPDDNKIEDVLV